MVTPAVRIFRVVAVVVAVVTGTTLGLQCWDNVYGTTQDKNIVTCLPKQTRCRKHQQTNGVDAVGCAATGDCPQLQITGTPPVVVSQCDAAQGCCCNWNLCNNQTGASWTTPKTTTTSTTTTTTTTMPTTKRAKTTPAKLTTAAKRATKNATAQHDGWAFQPWMWQSIGFSVGSMVALAAMPLFHFLYYKRGLERYPRQQINTLWK